MANKRFPLEMPDGTKVRTLEELRAHFDEETVIAYFEDGMLTRWLEDRFYDDEANALRAINPDTPDFRQQLLHVLDVDGSLVGLDEEAVARLLEKQTMLRKLTHDPTILSRAAQTAFDQEDLAELLGRGETKIYLCGKEFRIPLQSNVSYEGILGTPKAIVKVNSMEELNVQDITLVNVVLPWDEEGDAPRSETPTTPDRELPSEKKWLVPRTQLQAMAAATFKEDFDCYKIDSFPTFLMVDETSGTAVSNLTDAQKNAAISLICGTDYTEGDIVHLRISDDMSEGWAFTADSFCIVAKASRGIRDEQIRMHGIMGNRNKEQWNTERKLTMEREEEIIPYTSLSKPLKKISKEMANMCHVFGHYTDYNNESAYNNDKNNFCNAVKNGDWAILNNYGLFLLNGSGIIWYDEMFGYRKKSKKQQNAKDENGEHKNRLGSWPLKRFLSNMKNIFKRTAELSLELEIDKQ